jgi:hypothetical protein
MKWAQITCVSIVVALLLSGGACCILSAIYENTDLAVVGGSLIVLDAWTAFCIWLGGEA